MTCLYQRGYLADKLPLTTLAISADKVGRFHFIGIGGVGMSGIARILIRQGYSVSGSDLNAGEVTRQLAAEGAVIYEGHAAGNIGPDVTQVVVSSAVPSTNAEVAAARNRGLAVLHRGDMLAFLMNSRQGIAIAGAHGKTTTSAMVSLVLERNGLSPSVLVGGQVKEFNGNARLGTGDYLVAEADESDGSFLKLTPFGAVVTNVENDHLDYYHNLVNIQDAFTRFLDQIKGNGFAVVCGDDPFLNSWAERNTRRRITYGLGPDRDLRVENIQGQGLKTGGDVSYRGQKLGQLTISVPGQHNLLNALAAVGVGLELGLNFSGIADSLDSFAGVHRRFEIMGEVNGVLVVDDYAHHPSEIKATLKAARQIEARRVLAVFQPHRFTRTYFLRKEFGRAFQDADQVIINEIYPAGEQPIEGVSARILAEEINQQQQRPVKYLPDRAEIVRYLAGLVQPGDLVITMGAGHIWTVGRDLLQQLKDQA